MAIKQASRVGKPVDKSKNLLRSSAFVLLEVHHIAYEGARAAMKHDCNG